MRLIWILLVVLLFAGIYIYQDPDFRSQMEEISADAGFSKKTAHLYKWRNAAGEWQITDTLPPEGIEYKKLDLREDENVLPLPPALGGEE
jgi:hypothetical protein